MARARGKLFNDLYDLQADGPHDVVAANGTAIRVSSQNVASCPAFSDCAAQQHWLDKAYLRSGIAVGGCVLVDIALYVDPILWVFPHCPVYGAFMLMFPSLLHTGMSIWFTLNAIHGVNPEPAIPHNEEMKKYEEEKSSWVQSGKAVTQSERSLGIDSWNRSNAALLSPKTFGVHDAGSHSSSLVSVISAQDSPQFLDSPREPPSPAFSSLSHFGPPKGGPSRNSFFSPLAPQLQRMDFPDPVKIDSPMRLGEYDYRISPLSFPQRPFSGIITPNFSRPSSRGGDPQIPMPDQYSFYPQVAHSNPQKSLALSLGLSHHSESGQLPNGRPETADLSKPENELTALPPVPPFKDLRTNQIGWT